MDSMWSQNRLGSGYELARKSFIIGNGWDKKGNNNEIAQTTE